MAILEINTKAKPTVQLFKIGQVFRLGNYYYILAVTQNGGAKLIDIIDGNRWNEQPYPLINGVYVQKVWDDAFIPVNVTIKETNV